MVDFPVWPKFKGAGNIDLRLHNVTKFLGYVGNPHHNINNVIHVAGTNGKGSTISFLRSFFEANGYSVNIYTSPHLVEFNERIRIRGKLIDNEYLDYLAKKCKNIAEKYAIEPSFFEGTTIIAFLSFMENPADYNIIEVGLGGRLDATNVISNKIASVITNISLDHQEFLGDDILSIAREKLGIYKNTEKLFFGKQSPIVNNLYKTIKGNSYFYDEYAENISLPKEIGLGGKHQIENYKLAAKIFAELVGKEINSNFINHLYWPGRMQNITKLLDVKTNAKIYIDGGHNESAAYVIADFVREKNIKNILISKSISKNITKFIEILQNCHVNLFFTEMEFSDSYKIIHLDENTKSKFQKLYYNVTDALAELKLKDDNLLICGSLFLVGEILKKCNYKLS
jgi:dihydrofolate synthase/folylpolyglutamate synthase